MITNQLEHTEELEEKECTNCEILREWLEKEVSEKEYLRSVLFTNARLIPKEDIETNDVSYQSVNKHIPFRIKRAQKEMEQRRKAHDILVNKGVILSPGEQLFEEELQKVK